VIDEMQVTPAPERGIGPEPVPGPAAPSPQATQAQVERTVRLRAERAHRLEVY
jgi:hypothetical protein